MSFRYRTFKDGRVVVSWEGKEAATLKGRAAQAFLSAVSEASEGEAQLRMARLTGNFKRGNERHKNIWKTSGKDER